MWQRDMTKRVYGITLDDFCKIWANQDGKCANPLCNSILEYGKRGVHVDHDHETGKVRGLLCAQCNVALGQLEENANRMIGLATYILQHKDGCYD